MSKKEPNKTSHGDARTSANVAKQAAKVLNNPKSTNAEKSVAASALRQRQK